MQRLLEAALLPEDQAEISWKKYLDSHDLQTIDASSIALLPLVYRNLKEKSHPLCKSSYRHTWTSNQTLWAKTGPTLQMLLESGVKTIFLLKGMALILEHYRDFGVRVIGDIDILIQRSEVPFAFRRLIESGWTCTLRRLDPHNLHQLDRWHAANFTHPSGLRLDLHWSFLLESNHRLDREIFESSAPGIHPLNPTYLLLQTCVHGLKKSTAPLIRWVPDAMYLLKAPIDFPHLFALAKKHHLQLPLFHALSYLKSHFNAPIPDFEFDRKSLSLWQRWEYKANQKGSIYMAAYCRARLNQKSLLSYLQHTANLSSPWLIIPYIPYWILKRLYRLCKSSS